MSTRGLPALPISLFQYYALARKITLFYLPQPDQESDRKSTIQAPRPERLLDQPLLDRPDSTLFEPSYYRKLLPALADYRYVTKRYGKMEAVRQLPAIGKAETIEVVYQNGRLSYEVRGDKFGRIRYITIRK